MRKDEIFLFFSLIVSLCSPQIISTLAGDGKPSFSGDGGLALNATFSLIHHLSIDQENNVYICDAFNNRIRMVSRGIITTIAGNGAASWNGDGKYYYQTEFNSPFGVSVAPTGDVYIADTANNRIRMLNILGIVTTIAGTGVPSYSGDGGPATDAAIFQPEGVLYHNQTIYIADSLNNRVRQIDLNTNIITTYAGNGAQGYSGDNGPAVNASMNQPRCITIDRLGNMYITDGLNNRIRKIDATGIISTFAGTGVAGYNGDNIPAVSAWLSNPIGISVDSQGNVYFSDYGNNRVRMVDLTGFIRPFAGTGNQGFSGDGNLAKNASLYRPIGIFVDNFDSVFIADAGNRCIRLVTDGIINTIAGDGSPSYSGDGGPASTALLNEPVGVTHFSGKLYLADTHNHRVRVVDLNSGVINLVAGNGIPSFSGDGGSAVLAGLNRPGFVTTDSVGNIYISENSNHRVRKVDILSGFITTVAGNGIPTFAGDDGFAVNASLYAPEQVNAARKMTCRVVNLDSGIISTLAGNGGAGFNGDGIPALEASLNFPYGVICDNNGNILISDYYNCRIRQVNASSGIINTIAGTGLAQYNGDFMPAINATLNRPFGLTLDKSGNILFADNFNNKIRLIDSQTGIITTIAGSGVASFSGDTGPAFRAGLVYPGSVAVDERGNIYFTDAFNGRIRMVTNTPCESDTNCQNVQCWRNSVCFSGQCIITNSSLGLLCNDGIFCNGADSCDVFAKCSVHDDAGMANFPCSCPPNSDFFGQCACKNGVCALVSTNTALALKIFLPISIVTVSVTISLIIFAVRRYIKRKIAQSYQPMQNVLELPPSLLFKDVMILEVLGEGNFGRVFKGSWQNTHVALKELKDTKNFEEFIQEAHLLQSLRHPHIVTFFGVFMHNETPNLMMEFMNQGSLSDFLQLNQHLIHESDLANFLLQTLRGMTYLEKSNVIHRDLAARNLLVSSVPCGECAYTVKVSDFGLGKVLANDDKYYAKNTKIPVKWSPHEVLKYSKFSHKSDVWSFGVVIWEVFSYGAIPYPGMTNQETTQKVCNGYRMEAPLICPQLWKVWMSKCWSEKPDIRPTFVEICKVLDSNPEKQSKEEDEEEEVPLKKSTIAFDITEIKYS